MMLIKVIKNNGDYIFTKINGTLKEIAEHYFQNDEIKEIQIVEGGDNETKFYTKTPLKIYRASKKEIDIYELDFKIRCTYAIYHKDTSELEKISCGLI